MPEISPLITQQSHGSGAAEHVQRVQDGVGASGAVQAAAAEACCAGRQAPPHVGRVRDGSGECRAPRYIAHKLLADALVHGDVAVLGQRRLTRRGALRGRCEQRNDDTNVCYVHFLAGFACGIDVRAN